MTSRQLVSVDEVSDRKSLQRFRELPFALHHDDRRWARPVLAFEQWRLDPHRNPFFDRGDAAYFLARRIGVPAGRLTAHIRHEGDEGWFGFFDVVDDATVAGELLDAARGWLDARGCRSMSGPVSFTADIEDGVQIDGFGAAGVTGRQWHPPHYAELLERHGLRAEREMRSWRIEVEPSEVTPPMLGDAAVDGSLVPPHAGAYADPRLVLVEIAAVPDVSGALRSSGLRSAWSLARRAKGREWQTAVVVRVDADPSALVPLVMARAAACGYRQVVAPWSPDAAAAPETVHARFRIDW